MRDNPYFTEPANDNPMENSTTEAPQRDYHSMLLKLLTGESCVFINGEDVIVPEITWDGTQNSSVQAAFQLLANCECCDEHQKKKPETLSGWTETPSTTKNESRRCTCTCRHRMRFMARQFN